MMLSGRPSHCGHPSNSAAQSSINRLGKAARQKLDFCVSVCLALAWYYAGIYLSSHLALLTCTNIFGPIMSLPEPMVEDL